MVYTRKNVKSGKLPVYKYQPYSALGGEGGRGRKVPVICDVIGIAQYHFLKSKMAAMYFALYQNFKLFLSNLYWKTLETELKRF